MYCYYYYYYYIVMCYNPLYISITFNGCFRQGTYMGPGDSDSFDLLYITIHTPGLGPSDSDSLDLLYITIHHTPAEDCRIHYICSI